MLPREANFRSVVKIARATDEPCPGDPIETYGDARRDALLWADDEIDRLRVALARICCEAHCNPHNIADAALGRPTAQEKWSIIEAAKAKEGKS